MPFLFKTILLLVFLCATNFAKAQIGSVISRKQPKINVGKKETASGNEAFKSHILKLTKTITRDFESDKQKSRAIFNWIATNIAYDTELQLDKNLQQKIYKSEENVVLHVLSRKKALCGGYSFLFREMCKAVNIEAKIIHGYTKTKGVKRKNNRVHHTWNAIKINGKWELADISWARSRSVNGMPNKFWFGTNPQDFIKSHLPENPRWTLLNSSVSLAEFDLD